MSLTWNDLFFSGSVVSLSTSIWRARLGLKPADLGIDDTEAVSKALVLGGHRLAPAAEFERINKCVNDARRAVESASVSFGFIPYPARYVPAKNLNTLGDTLKVIRDAFTVAVEDFIERYDVIKDEMLPVIEQALKEAAKTPEAAATAIDRVRSEYPGKEDVRRKFALYWNVFAVQAPKQQGTTAELAREGEVVKDVLRDMVAEIRGEVKDKLADVLKLIAKGGNLKTTSIASAHETLNRVESINVMGDEQLTTMVRQLRNVLAGIKPNERISDAQISGLESIKGELETGLDEAVKAAEAKLTGMGRRKVGARAAIAPVAE